MYQIFQDVVDFFIRSIGMFFPFGVSASKRPCAVSLLVFVSSSCP